MHLEPSADRTPSSTAPHPSPPVPRRRRGVWHKLALLAVAGLAALVVAEIVARVALSVLLERPPRPPQPGRETKMLDLVQKSPHADLVYELQPNLDCTFQGVPVRTNAHGWRGPDVALTKPANGFRVLGLGDSVLFGWGVPFADTGTARLETRLRAELPGRAVDVIDTGIPGYNTAMQAELLRQRGLAFRPDVVLVDFVGNDFDLPNFLLAPTDYWRLDRCFLLDLARRVRRSHWQSPWSPFEGAPMANDSAFESDPRRVPEQYRHLVGPEAYHRALGAIVELGRTHGFRVLVTAHYALNGQARAACTELGVPVVELGDRIATWLRERDDPPYVGSELTISRDDPHPTAIVHGWWADAVCTKLQELRWLPR